MSEFSKRVVGPAGIMLGAFAFIGIMVTAFSRILLAVPEIGSTSLALLVSAEILGVCGVLAATKHVNATQRILLVTLVMGLLGGGVAAGAIGVRPFEGHAEEIHLAAEGLKFDTEALEVPADTAFKLVFENNDATIPHNVSIWEDDAFTTSLFVGETFPGVATKEYEVEPIPAGSYAFRCDVHPDMKGSVEASGEGGEGGEPTEEPTEEPGEPEGASIGSPTATSVTVTAAQFAFDATEITMAAGEETEIELVNDDTPGVPHNLSIYADAAYAEQLHDGTDATAPETVTDTLEPFEAGEYYFKCDFHPDMAGTITFA